MTRPDHPRPEVVALATGLRARYDRHIPDAQLQEVARVALENLPAPFAIVDMDALTERVRKRLHDRYIYHSHPEWCEQEARRLLGEA